MDRDPRAPFLLWETLGHGIKGQGTTVKLPDWSHSTLGPFLSLWHHKHLPQQAASTPSREIGCIELLKLSRAS